MKKPQLAEHFDSWENQEHAGRLGMWVFLASEILLFAGFFGLYATYRAMYGADFIAGVRNNNLLLGSVNTLVLITSSFTVAMAIHFIRHDKPKVALGLVLATLAMGGAFLVIKGIEYGEHFHHGIYPGTHYRYAELSTFGAKMFFTLYYLMTGTHALHVVIGMGVLTWAAVCLARGRWDAQRNLGLELAGLYWHLVDVIWIFLWPLLYLAR